jgi:hypothetical protein
VRRETIKAAEDGRDPRTWRAQLLALRAGGDGRAAFAWVARLRDAFPLLLTGAGAPVLDPLLPLPGFREAWRASNDTRDEALGFRLALLGVIDDGEVAPSTVEAVAADVTQMPRGPSRSAALDAAARVYGARWKGALRQAIVNAPRPVDGGVVRLAAGDDPDEIVSLALRSSDACSLLERLGAFGDAGWAALERRATELATRSLDEPWLAWSALAVFLRLARSGRPAPTPLVSARALGFASDFPEEASPLVREALALLPEDARGRLVAESAPFAWRYAAASADARVLAAAVRALDSPMGEPEVAWAIRTFAAWGELGRRELTPVASSSRAGSAMASRILEALDAFAARTRTERRLEGVRPSLRRAIEDALDALDADPAAWPPRRVQLPVLAFGEPLDLSSGEPSLASWGMVAAFAAFAAPEVIAAQVRMLPADEPSAPDIAPTERSRTQPAALLLALGRMVLPAWDAIYPEDHRPIDLLTDAENVLGGAPAVLTEARRALHEEAYSEERPNRRVAAAWGAARVIVWAHSAALDDGENDEQDTPPDLAVWPFKEIEGGGASPVVRARTFWERFLLEVVPAVAAESRR